MIGKINDRFFTKHILKQTGKQRQEVVVGPKMGVDAAILKIGDSFMAVAEDPIFPGPTTSPKDFAWILLHIGASDVAVTGIDPQFMTYTLLLPPGTPETYAADLVSAVNRYADEMGISIVGGHTGFYGAVSIPTIGGITVWGFGKRYITPAGARVGDKIIMTKGVAVEAAGILAYELEEKMIRDGMSQKIVTRAKERFFEMSVVKDAEIAFKAGGNNGVHSMHDATEGGLFRGLWEIAEASGTGLRVHVPHIIVPEDIKYICDYFKLNPYEIISEGTLILTCSPEVVDNVLFELKAGGIDASVIGDIVSAEEGRLLLDANGGHKELVPPETDKFWEVFFNALEIKDDTRSTKDINLCRQLDSFVEMQKEKNISCLIAEIGTNIVYAHPDAQTIREMASVPGRLIRCKNKVHSFFKSEMGESKYMAESLQCIRLGFDTTRCIMNLRGSLSVFNACEKAGLNILYMPETPDLRQSDEDYISDLKKMISVFKNKSKKAPDAIFIPDRVNLEKLVLLTAETLDELNEKIDKILKNM